MTGRKTMSVKNILACAALTLTLCACGGKDEPSAEPRSVELKGLPLDAKDQNAKVARRLAVQGRWVGDPDPADKGRRIVIEVAGTSEYTIDLVGTEAGAEAVFASGRGRLSWNGRDLLVGEGEAGGPLAAYARWTAGFPSEDVMTVRTSKGDVELKRAS